MTNHALVAAAICGMLCAGPAVAIEGNRSLFAIYGWLSGVDGEVTVRGLSAEVDESFSDLAESLEGAAMLHFETRRDRWLLLADAIFVSVADQGRAAEVDLDQTILEVLGGYALSESFEVLLGGRYMSLEPKISLTGPVARSAEGRKDWLDPVIGGRYWTKLAARWDLVARADVGGFGVGSDLTWNLAVNAILRASDSVSVVLGYRLLEVDLEEGRGRERFVYDMTTSGPQVGVAFHF